MPTLSSNRLSRRRLAALSLVLFIAVAIAVEELVVHERVEEAMYSEIKLGFLPDYRSLQFLVAYDSGLYRAFEGLGVEVRIIAFDNSPLLAAALASGEVDVAYIDLASLAGHAGDGIVVVAGGTTGLARLLAKEHVKAAIEDGEIHSLGKAIVLGTTPRGSSPYLLAETFIGLLGLGSGEIVVRELPIGELRDEVLTGSLDIVAAPEPIASLAQEAGYVPLEGFEGPRSILGYGVSVLAVSESLARVRPDVVEALVEIQVEASKILLEDPSRAAESLSRVLGEAFYTPQTLLRPLEGGSVQVTPDPRDIWVVLDHVDVDPSFYNEASEASYARPARRPGLHGVHA